MNDLSLPTIILLLIIFLPIISKLFSFIGKPSYKVIEPIWMTNERNHVVGRKALKEYEKSQYYAKGDNDLEKVIFHLTNAINLRPIGRYYCSRAIYRESKEDFNGALEDYNKAIELDSSDVLSLFCRGKLYNKWGKLNLACKDWKKAEQLGSLGATNALKAYCTSIYPDNQTNASVNTTISTSNKLLNFKNNWILSKKRQILQFESIINLLNEKKLDSIGYSDLLNCFEWKFTRFKILVRDKFCCADCNIKSDKLHVHHKYYIKNAMPWEIEDNALISLCASCHSKRHEDEYINVYNKIENQLIATHYHNLRCPRCNGSGYLHQFNHVEGGICFRCRGEVISKTLFNNRLIDIFSNQNTYDVAGEYAEFELYMNFISTEFYKNCVYEKIDWPSESSDLPF